MTASMGALAPESITAFGVVAVQIVDALSRPESTAMLAITALAVVLVFGERK